MACCRVEPKAASHVFVVHGQACLHSPTHPTCTHTKEGVKPAGKSYVVDLKPILGSDWRVLPSPTQSCSNFSCCCALNSAECGSSMHLHALSTKC